MTIKIDVNLTGTESLVSAINALAEVMGKEKAIKREVKKIDQIVESNPLRTITLEEVRAKLSNLSQSGKQKEVKALIKKYGATKLSEISKNQYPNLMKDAEEM